MHASIQLTMRARALQRSHPCSMVCEKRWCEKYLEGSAACCVSRDTGLQLPMESRTAPLQEWISPPTPFVAVFTRTSEVTHLTVTKTEHLKYRLSRRLVPAACPCGPVALLRQKAASGQPGRSTTRVLTLEDLLQTEVAESSKKIS